MLLRLRLPVLPSALCLTLFALAACHSGPERAPVIGQAFVGPAALKIRSDIPLQSATVTTVKHGERLEIVNRRRRFLKVRTANGQEGWTDERQLLAADDMDSLRDLMEQARAMLAQGQATTFGELNVHTQPWRQSPSFLQVKEGEKVDVLLHRALPRTEMPRKPLLPPPPKKAKASKKPKDPPKYPPLSMPKPPQPPANWLELSKTNPDPDAVAAEEAAKAAKEEKEAEEAAPPAQLDDWSLVRLSNGTAGWVLTRRLVMAIPDDVAQYAEGRRIVSYFSLGEVRDEDRAKHNWLWTTVGPGNPTYDFDSFRVFVWSLRRHRYETAYIERNVKAYAPVLLRSVQLGGGKGRGAVAAGTFPGFSICMEKQDGQRVRREYAFIGNIVRYAGDRACESLPPVTQKAPGATPLPLLPPLPQPAQPSFAQRLQQRVKSITRGWFGH